MMQGNVIFLKGELYGFFHFSKKGHVTCCGVLAFRDVHAGKNFHKEPVVYSICTSERYSQLSYIATRREINKEVKNFNFKFGALSSSMWYHYTTSESCIVHDSGPWRGVLIGTRILGVLVHAPSFEPAGVCSETPCSGPNLKIWIWNGFKSLFLLRINAHNYYLVYFYKTPWIVSKLWV